MAALASTAGCEQWKAPKRIEDLEKRVGELTKQVEALQGKKRRAARPAGKPASDHGEHADKQSDGEGEGEAAVAKDSHGDKDDDGEKKDDDGHGDKKDDDSHGEKKDDAKDDDGHGEKKDDAKDDGHGESAKDDGHGDKADKKDDDGHGDKADKEAKADKDDHGDKADKEAKADGHGEKPDKEAKADKSEKADKEAKAGGKNEKDTAAMKNLLAVVEQNTKKGEKPGDKTEKAKDEPPRWSYDGKTGPAAWASLDPSFAKCGKGRAQSPIDITPKAGTASPVVFHYNPTAASIIDTGNTLQVNFEAGSSIEIGDTLYKLETMQVHTPSEHTIAGEHYPLELQLTHKSASGKLAAISVMYDIGIESKALGTLWSAWPRKLNTEQKLKKTFDPSALLPETRSLFRYNGSLTSPPCTEGVVWNVLRRTMTDSKQHLAVLGVHFASNARGTQALNNRKIE